MAAPGPAGKHTLWGYTHVPIRPIGDALQPEARTDWARSGELFADRMEATIEAHAPGFRELILARRVWTPADLEAANANVVGGDINAGSFAIDRSCCSARGWTGGAGAPPVGPSAATGQG